MPEVKKTYAADEQGRYVLEGLCPAQYTVVINHIGCKPDTFKVKLFKNSNRDFTLEHHWQELQEVEISAERTGEDLSEITLKEKEVEQSRGLPLGEMLKRINGISSLQTGANISKPLIQGFTSNRVKIINSGLEHQSQMWGDEHAPEIDPFMEADYKVVKGAGAVKYGGGAIGGMVVVEPKPLPRTPGISGQWNGVYATNNHLLNSSLMLQGSLKKIPGLSWRLQGSLKQAGNVRTPDYYQANTASEESNYSWRLGYFRDRWNLQLDYMQFNTRIGIFSGAHIGNLSDLRNAFAREEPRPEHQGDFTYEIGRPYQYVQHETFKVNWNYYLGESMKLSVSGGRQFNIREEFDKTIARTFARDGVDFPEFSVSLENYDVLAALEWDSGNEFSHEIGIQYNQKENTLHSIYDFIPDYHSLQYSAYWLEKWEHRQWRVETGLRYDWMEMDVNKVLQRELTAFDHRFSTWTAKLGVFYQLTEQMEVEGGLTYAERPPAINEMYSDGLHHGSASVEFGSRELQPEQSQKMHLGVNGKQGRLAYTLYGFANYIADYIYLEPQGLELTIRGAFPSFNWASTNALLRGIDAGMDYAISEKLDFSSRWSLLWGNDVKNEQHLIFMPPWVTDQELTYKLPSKLKNVDNAVGIGYRYTFRQHRFEESMEFVPPPDGYGLIYLTASRSFQWRKLKGSLILRLNNLLNTEYRDYLNRFRYYTDAPGRNLTINFKINF